MLLSTPSALFLIIDVLLIIGLPRRKVPAPLLIGACYITMNQGIDVGPFSFPIIRLLVLAAMIRVIIRSEWISGGINKLDRIVIMFCLWAIFSSFFHENPTGAFVNRLGLIFNTAGMYFLLRIFCQSMKDALSVCCFIAILLTPLALEMAYEKINYHNLFSFFGGVSEHPAIREGKIRAQGPFEHAILAGTVGAVCFPLMFGLWNIHRRYSILGMASSVTIVFCSASSGPIFSVLAGMGALFLWNYRDRMHIVRWSAVLGYIGLEIVMKAPAYYMIARVDAVGGSTGYHRARLIESAFQHLNEWWFIGTDYTRHWMPTGVSWSPNHTDITNHYIQMGVVGGLPLMLLFIMKMVKSYSFIGSAMEASGLEKDELYFFFWAIGASLFVHTATCISVAYFDQSIIFFYFSIAIIGSIFSYYRTSETS